MQGTILIADDNPSVIDSLSLFLKRKVEQVLTVTEPSKIPKILKSEPVDVVLLDMNFSAGDSSGSDGLFWLQEIKKINPNQVVILITAYGGVELAVKALKLGATDFVLKPWDNQKLLATISSALELSRTRQQVNQLKQSFNISYQKILGQSNAIQQVFNLIAKVAPTDANVLILGENGTGKELVAREIHQCSARANSIFLSIDLGSLTESLFESELFGHKKGAFTDAKDDRDGRLVLASGGTLFLDEIGNLSQAMQSKLLTVLQNREVIPVGSTKAIPIDVRLICATNRNINAMVANNQFREDLLYRINTIQIDLPPLRERDDDILLLANHYLVKYSEKYSKSPLSFSGSAIEKIMAYSWPGNVRELRHAVERAVILSEGAFITPQNLFIQQSTENVSLGDKPISLEEAEKAIISNSIKRNKGNISVVAKELGVGRQTLYRKIKEYGL